MEESFLNGFETYHSTINRDFVAILDRNLLFDFSDVSHFSLKENTDALVSRISRECFNNIYMDGLDVNFIAVQLMKFPNDEIQSLKLFKRHFGDVVKGADYSDLRYRFKVFFRCRHICSQWDSRIMQEQLLPSVISLLGRYPEFLDIADASELDDLLVFCNFMRAASISMKSAKNKRRLLLDVCSLVEGKHRTYITGSGASERTLRRVLIYERETGTTKVERPIRKVFSDHSSPSRVGPPEKRRKNSINEKLSHLSDENITFLSTETSASSF
jgi:hypothetical protein